MNIRLFKPSLGDRELIEVKKTFDASWVGLGPKVAQFENAWKAYLGCNEAIALNSATAALHLALASFDFPPGKKVLVPALTFAATATAVLYNRLEPVFIDSDPVTLGMDITDLENKYDSDCVAIVAVHYAGHPVPMEKLVPWAREKDLKIIEDCAHTSGSKYNGKSLGLWGDIGCFSFEEKKLMTTGDGGMICSNDPLLLKNIKAMRWVGIDKDNWKTAKSYTESEEDALHWYYEISVLGYKYNMNDLAASIGIAQLEKLDAMNLRRSQVITAYINGIEGIPNIEPLLPYEPENYAYQIFGVRVEDKDKFILHMKSKGIATGCHYTPLTLQPLFKKYSSQCIYIEEEYNHMVTIPLHSDLTNLEVQYILDAMSQYMNNTTTS